MTLSETLPFCNVEEYFSCVVPVLKWGIDGGFSNAKCPLPCDHIDYTAWQDMNELPSNILPKLIDTGDEEEDTESEEEPEEEVRDLEVIQPVCRGLEQSPGGYRTR